MKVTESDHDCNCWEVNKLFQVERKNIPTFLAILFAGIFAGYIFGWYFSPNNVNQTIQNQPTVQASPSPEVASKLSDVAISDSGEVIISTPRLGDTITTPIKVNGLVRAFENQVGMRLKNQDVVVVRETKFTAKQGEIGTYIALGADFTFAQPTVPQDGTFELFTFSARDGSEINKVIIPVKFAQHGGSGL